MNYLRCIVVFLVCWYGSAVYAEGTRDHVVGAWQLKGEVDRVMLVTSDYWTQTFFSREKRQFIRTMGGTYSIAGDVSSGVIQFDSQDKQAVGSSFTLQVSAKDSELRIKQDDGSEEVWTRIDRGDAPLAGVWRIEGRHVDGAYTEMPLRARRTLKILTGTRFQWIAMNIETGEFSGTGGGTYAFENGKYIEKIEFFSRDASRVGASLEFEGVIKEGKWEHRGLSSKGEPIHEVWGRFAAGTNG